MHALNLSAHNPQDEQFYRAMRVSISYLIPGSISISSFTPLHTSLSPDFN